MKKQYISFTEACNIIKKGGVVAIPTETVYGLAGSVFSESALKKIFHIKKRPFFNPLIIHCASTRQMNRFHNVNVPLLQKMITYFSPGPVTFILHKTHNVHPLITAGQEKVGLRIPHHPLTLKLIRSTEALCAPSANLFGQLSPTRAEHIYSTFKEKVPILDGGKCNLGIESTVLEPDFKNNIIKILRPGLISEEDIKKWLKKEKKEYWIVKTASSSFSPGQLKKHYQPSIPLILIEIKNTNPPTNREVIKKLRHLFPGKIFKQLKLNPSAVLSARMLYHQLNALQKPLHVIYIIKDIGKSKTGPWKAIWNRLNKAASHQIQWKG